MYYISKTYVDNKMSLVIFYCPSCLWLGDESPSGSSRQRPVTSCKLHMTSCKLRGNSGGGAKPLTE